MKRSYNLIFLISLNLICFISQFFDISNDLNFTLFVINSLFFINVIWDIIIKSYNNNYISLLQSKVESPVNLLDMFDVENAVMPNNYNCSGIYVLIKGVIYYRDDNTSVKLSPKKFNQRKSPINMDEVKYIVSQLNNLEIKYNQDIKVKSFYKHPDLYQYSQYIIYDEVKNNKFRNFIYKGIPFLSNVLNTIFIFVYFVLGFLAMASVFGSNWFSWFTLIN